MTRILRALSVWSAVLLLSLPGRLMAQPQPYEWTTQSRNSSESMPCGGGDVGLNVWVEQGDVLFYLSRSGCFDENNTLLKLGRFRLRLSEPFQEAAFRQRLVLNDGYCELSDGRKQVVVWADVWKPVVHVDVVSAAGQCQLEVVYESWRTEDHVMTRREGFQTSWKFALPKGQPTRRDTLLAGPHDLYFAHQNGPTTIFDATVGQQRMDSVKARMYNPLRHRVFGGWLQGDHLDYQGQVAGCYASTPYVGYRYASAPARRHHVQIVMATCQGTLADWQSELARTRALVNVGKDRQASRRWWNEFWQRSFIEAPADGANPRVPRELYRNYTLFRYMLGCNAHSAWPTKFNGGLFTFDPQHVNTADEYQLSADFRNWGGGVHTAQNQRLVYWPLLKSGDYDALRAQLDFYLRILPNAELRSRVYWHHDGACFTEQMENYGLPCYPEYGTKRPDGFDPGMERNAWLEYEWDTALEFCMMALEAHRYGGMDIVKYEPLIASCLEFFDAHYKFLAQQRGAKTLDGEGHLILYPGSGGETFKGAYNSASTIAALRGVAEAFMRYLGENGTQTTEKNGTGTGGTNAAQRAAHGAVQGQAPARSAVGEAAVAQPGHVVAANARSSFATISGLEAFLNRLPPLPVGDGRLLPALHWERVQNVETTQLYPVWPWRMYGVGRPDLDVARRTYEQDTLALRFRSHIGWKQDAIWAACLGLKDEAARLVGLKLADGPYRFPAFWGPGYDWSPDHNWGGSGMIALQEMLLQEVGDRLLLFPTWPREWDVRFRLHASGNTVVEAEVRDGKARLLSISPKERAKDCSVAD